MDEQNLNQIRIAANRLHKWWIIHVQKVPRDFVILASDLKSKFELKVNIDESIPKGRVVKITAPPEYNPDQKRKGGRMVRRMPKQLQKMKEAQDGK